MTRDDVQRMTNEVARALRARIDKSLAIVIYIGEPHSNLAAMCSDIPKDKLPAHLRALADQVEKGQ